MSPLTAIIREKIATDGPISFADYMALALAHPEHGYYIKRDPFGLAGDFITSPEISQIFGEMIGLWCAQMWMQRGCGPISLVELGPGRGSLMADVLRATKTMAGFHEAITIHMIETSPVLAHAQYTRLRDAHPRIEWLDRVEALPDSPTLLIANEFFDALPVKQYVMSENGLRERRVGWDEASQSFVFTLTEAGLGLAKSGTAIPVGTVMEHSPMSRSIMRQLAGHLRTHGGAGLIIDYGYLGEAHHDTVQAIRAHVFHPVLRAPGEADITAHVDFTSLMDIARAAGHGVPPLVNQGEFLLRMGAQLRLEMLLRQATPAQREPLIAGLERLISPHAMGELFKVMGFASDPRLELPGFTAGQD
ncbi:MAG: SAM-dependent methyltransferase [Alphaproteobacteria bacterium]|nr:SAM-dependent methyltransferase [Alphaproteobacteria bacterium]